MASHDVAFARMIRSEGGFKRTKNAHDTGGDTYAGISRKMHPEWSGWGVLDAGGTPETGTVKEFYRVKFWLPVNGDNIVDQGVASMLYSFGVNADPRVAVKIVQVMVGALPDGVMGPVTTDLLNKYPRDKFPEAFALGKLARYSQIIWRNRDQEHNLFGWVNRILEEVKWD